MTTAFAITFTYFLIISIANNAIIYALNAYLGINKGIIHPRFVKMDLSNGISVCLFCDFLDFSFYIESLIFLLESPNQPRRSLKQLRME